MVLFLFSLIFKAYQQIESSCEPRRQYLLTLVTQSLIRKKEDPQAYISTYFLYDFLARMSLPIFHNGIRVSGERQWPKLAKEEQFHQGPRALIPASYTQYHSHQLKKTRVFLRINTFSSHSVQTQAQFKSSHQFFLTFKPLLL